MVDQIEEERALKYAGVMGHRYVVTSRGADGGRRLVGEFNSVRSARTHALSCGADARVYKKVASNPRRWSAVL